MDILIDNRDLKEVFGITCLDYFGALSFAAERRNEREWADKSGVDKNTANIRYEPKEFFLKCFTKASNEALAYANVRSLIEYIYSKGVVVLSLRDSERNIRECFLIERSTTITGEINLRQQNSLYYFKLGLRDINPNAVFYKTDIVGNSVTINYEKGQNAVIYWGDGSQAEVSNSGNYTKNDYGTDGPVDIFIDIDKDNEAVNPLQANFNANPQSGDKELTVSFGNLSSGDIEIWSWDFGDGNTSSEQSPEHIYTESGTYTVTLQVFNAAGGSDTETKVDYITVSPATFWLNDAEDTIWMNDAQDPILIN